MDASYADLPFVVRLDEKRSGEAELGGGNREDAAPENWCSWFLPVADGCSNCRQAGTDMRCGHSLTRWQPGVEPLSQVSST